MPVRERVPFDIAMTADKLFASRWRALSRPQQVILKAMYGQPLTDEELISWSILQGGAIYDDWGYVKQVQLQPYEPKEYHTLVAVLGRRSGKTDMVISTAAAYEITLGGHKAHVKEKQVYKTLFLAQTDEDAQDNMRYITMALEESPLLCKELDGTPTATQIRLKDGMVIEAKPANKATGRGHAIPVVIMDEVGFWYTDARAANPDFEVLRALSYAQLQFPNFKRFIASTPWSKQGILWKHYRAGTEGRKLRCEECAAKQTFVCEHRSHQREAHKGFLVVHASTAAMENPMIPHRRLVEIRREDPDAFPRESLALFLDSVSGWLNRTKIETSITPGLLERSAPTEAERLRAGISYTASLDPAFRKDSFTLCIGHHDAKEGMIQDRLVEWKPIRGVPLKPSDVLDGIKLVLDEFGITNVFSDQYQLESLQQLALDRGFTITGVDFTGSSKARICGSFKTLLDQERVKLLDNDDQRSQLESLEIRRTQAGHVQIAAPPGRHDDLAMVTILTMHQAVWLLAAEAPKGPKVLDPDKDHVKMGLEQIERKRREQAALALYEDD